MPAAVRVGASYALSTSGLPPPRAAALTSLNLNGCPFDGATPSALAAATRLQSLHLAGCGDLDERALAMLASMPALTQLELSRTQPKEQLAQLARLTPRLKIKSHFWL